MSFKTMDGVEVYDKHDVDLIKDSIDATTSQHTADIQQLSQGKADKSYAQETRQIATDARNSIGDDQHGLTGRVKAIEESIGDNNVAYSIKGRIERLEDHAVTVEQLNSGLNQKANTSYAEQTRQIANSNSAAISDLEDRASAIESTKANKTEIPDIVNDTVGATINSKLALIESDINQIVDNAIDDKFDAHAMTTTEATAMIDQYF